MKKTYKKAFARVEGLCYTLPWLIGFLAFTLYPILSSIYYSFTDFSITNTPKWIGLANYIEIFTKDKLAIPSLIVTFKYVFLSVPAKLIFALLIAFSSFRYFTLDLSLWIIRTVLVAMAVSTAPAVVISILFIAVNGVKYLQHTLAAGRY